MNEVGNNQEVTGKAHLVDDIQLELEPVVIVFTLAGVLRVISVQQYLKAIFQPIPGQLFEILLDGHAIRNREVRQKILAQANIQSTAAGDFDGVFQRFRQIGKQRRHLIFRFQILLFGILLGPAGILQGVAIVDADAGLMGLEIPPANETYVIGRHHWHRQFCRQRHGGVQAILIPRPGGALNFQIHPITINRLQPASLLPCQVVFLGQQQLPHFALACRGQHD